MNKKGSWGLVVAISFILLVGSLIFIGYWIGVTKKEKELESLQSDLDSLKSKINELESNVTIPDVELKKSFIDSKAQATQIEIELNKTLDDLKNNYRRRGGGSSIVPPIVGLY